MRASEAEQRWLELLNKSVQRRLKTAPRAELLQPLQPAQVSRTHSSSEGWWITTAKIMESAATLCLFIDNSHPLALRGLWYGACEENRAGISLIEQAGLQRWPHTQRIRGYETPRNLRYEDPWYQRYSADEYYYGWLEREAPPTESTNIPQGLVERITERLSALLVELGSLKSEVDLDLNTGDVPRTVMARREQARLRAWLFSNRDAAECFLCNRKLPVDLLVAAHIKARSRCTTQERRDYPNNLIPLCLFGCDALFERGYITVEGDRILAGPRVVDASELRRMIKGLPKKLSESTPGRGQYFDAHRQYHLKTRGQVDTR